MGPFIIIDEWRISMKMKNKTYNNRKGQIYKIKTDVQLLRK